MSGRQLSFILPGHRMIQTSLRVCGGRYARLHTLSALHLPFLVTLAVPHTREPALVPVQRRACNLTV